MVEHFKSLLLLLLVTMSIYLTHQLWYGQQPTELIADNVYEQITVEEPRSLEDIVIPYRIVTHINDASYILREGEQWYHIIWRELDNQLNAPLLEEDSLDDEAVCFLHYYFQTPVPLENELTWLGGAYQMLVSEVAYYRHDIDDEKEFSVVLTGKDDTESLVLSLPDDKAMRMMGLIEAIPVEGKKTYTYLNNDLISTHLDRDLDLRNSIYVPDNVFFMPPINLVQEELDSELLLKTFFVDYNLARVIEERDGGLIYTDGEKGLRLTSSGFEYSHPRLEAADTTLGYVDALRNSSNLLSYHGGWPEDLRLVTFNYVSRGRSSFYHAEWCMYYEGYPLYTKKPTEMIFNDSGLINYARYLFTPPESNVIAGNPVEVMGWQEALQIAVDLYEENSSAVRTKIRLEEMKIGYAAVGTLSSIQGVPVWFLQINGVQIYLGAESLEPLSEEDLL